MGKTSKSEFLWPQATLGRQPQNPDTPPPTTSPPAAPLPFAAVGSTSFPLSRPSPSLPPLSLSLSQYFFLPFILPSMFLFRIWVPKPLMRPFPDSSDGTRGGCVAIFPVGGFRLDLSGVGHADCRCCRLCWRRRVLPG